MLEKVHGYKSYSISSSNSVGYFHIKHVLEKENVPSNSFSSNLIKQLEEIHTKITLPCSILKKKSYNKKLPKVIRKVMENVNNFVRYKFAKDSSCYVNILRYVLKLNNRQDLIATILQLNLWLEFGVSQKTHLSLLSLGLSRNTVLELTKYIISTEKSKEQCLSWLRAFNWDGSDLSPIIIEDIKKVL